MIVICQNGGWHCLALQAVCISARVLEGLAEGKGQLFAV